MVPGARVLVPSDIVIGINALKDIAENSTLTINSNVILLVTTTSFNSSAVYMLPLPSTQLFVDIKCGISSLSNVSPSTTSNVSVLFGKSSPSATLAV